MIFLLLNFTGDFYFYNYIFYISVAIVLISCYLLVSACGSGVKFVETSTRLCKILNYILRQTIWTVQSIHSRRNIGMKN